MGERPLRTSIADAPELAPADRFVEALTNQDFDGVRAALAPHVHLRALLPGGPREWTGAAAVADRFARWFGDTLQFDALDSVVGAVGGRAHVRWRLRLQADRLGPGAFVVEQVAYADVDDVGRIVGLDVLCTGFLPERADG